MEKFELVEVFSFIKFLKQFSFRYLFVCFSVLLFIGGTSSITKVKKCNIVERNVESNKLKRMNERKIMCSNFKKKKPATHTSHKFNAECMVEMWLLRATKTFIIRCRQRECVCLCAGNTSWLNWLFMVCTVHHSFALCKWKILHHFFVCIGFTVVDNLFYSILFLFFLLYFFYWNQNWKSRKITHIYWTQIVHGMDSSLS